MVRTKLTSTIANSLPGFTIANSLPGFWCFAASTKNDDEDLLMQWQRLVDLALADPSLTSKLLADLVGDAAARDLVVEVPPPPPLEA